MQRSSLIQLTQITRVFSPGESEVRALDGITLEIHRGEYLAITGPSGSGKSTLLHIVGCLDTPTSGTYVLEGTDVSRFTDGQLSEIRNRRIGFVFQSFNLMPRYTALSNVELPLVYSSYPGDRREKAAQAMAAVHLSHRLHHRPNALSGGECQRVAIARALVNDPSVILADEPTGNLDSATGSEIIALLERLNRENHITIITVTHDKSVASRADRVIELRDGKIASDGGGRSC